MCWFSAGPAFRILGTAELLCVFSKTTTAFVGVQLGLVLGQAEPTAAKGRWPHDAPVTPALRARTRRGRSDGSGDH